MALEIACDVNEGRDHDDVRVQLQIGLQQEVAAELVVNEKEESKDIPQNDGAG